MKIFYSDRHRQHVPSFFLQRGLLRGNFEVPARADALLAACREMGGPILEPPPVDLATLRMVHRADYLAFLSNAHERWNALAEHGPEAVPNIYPSPEMVANGAQPSATIVGQVGWFTADTSCPIGEGTWQAAVAAAATAVAAADEAAAGRHAYALARPPGHHAYAARAGGHCYLNNAALAAERLLRQGARRVAIFDIDSHHGNGTQGIFWDRADVLFVSVHGDPDRYYPWYVGHAGERGAGPGEGCNLNLPLALGSGDREWLDAIETGLVRIREAAPDVLVLSLGFDASEKEPLNALAVTEDGFSRAGAAIGALRLPTAIVQEGGYAVSELGSLLTCFLDGFCGRSRG